jgi:rRNA maturation protein Nop10
MKVTHLCPMMKRNETAMLRTMATVETMEWQCPVCGEKVKIEFDKL